LITESRCLSVVTRIPSVSAIVYLSIWCATRVFVGCMKVISR
jgi:hypothetical protein